MTEVHDEAPPRRAARGNAPFYGPEADPPLNQPPPLGEQVQALYGAGRGLFSALGRFFAAYGALARAEAQVLQAGIPLFFIGAVALIALSVSLWACAVALIGWALTVATHSIGIALGILVFGHAVLLVAIWFAIRRGVHQATFPQARAELGALRQQLREDIARFVTAHPSAPPAAPRSPQDMQP